MIADFFKLAFRSIKDKKKRSWLTIIGIMIGVAAVVALISLSVGMNQAIEEEFEKVGSDKIMIMPGAGGGFQPGPSLGTSSLNENNLKTVRRIRGVESAEAMLTQTVKLEYGQEERIAMITGTTPELFESFPQFGIKSGRALRDNDKFKTVLGSTAASNSFSSDLKVRNKVDFGERSLRIVGIMESMGNPTDDRGFYIPLDTARELFNKEDEVSAIYVDTDDTFAVDKVADDIEDELEDERGKEDFSVQTTDQILESINNVLGLIQGLMLGIAALSLIVGGVGIMNTMYTSVLEKTREIGIMKAVGARNSHVMTIFLIESGMMGVIGGIIGIILGIIMGKIAEYGIGQMMGFTMLEISITPELIAGAMAFSFGIGALSGTLPARRAAKLKPVDALRYE